ncbi:MAG: TolC family protein [Phycisphaerales bacterium]|nr:TolC family protein [Phycisphaerales bacterium]
MALRALACASCAVAAGLIGGCASPFDQPIGTRDGRVIPSGASEAPPSQYRDDERGIFSGDATLLPNASPEDYVRYALMHSPAVEAAYQRWRAATERLPQVRALPDPRLSIGFFLDEVETRVGPQQAKLGVSQTFPWFGSLDDREDAAVRVARAAWRTFEAVRLSVTERAIGALHELVYLDAATRITNENMDLLQSFEEVVRARYRVGAGSHPELVRVQVELGQLNDRLEQLRAMRPAFVAELNAVLNRPADAEAPVLQQMPERVVAIDAAGLAEIARQTNPALQALDERIEEQRALARVAQKNGLPDLTVGLDYTFTGEARDPSIPESGDDPVMLTFGVNVPLWREKYDAGVREAIARRLEAAADRDNQSNQIMAAIERAWFEHTDADRRVRLYERTLMPKAQESLRASLAGFRASDTSFLDLLDTERTLLEFALAAERAKADRGKALARLHTLVGQDVPTRSVTDILPREVNE